MLEVRFYDKIEDSQLDFAVIIARTGEKWVFCKHKETFGMLYVADIFSFEEIHSEIEKIVICDELIKDWTYPLIQPKLIEEAARRGHV